MTFNKGLLIICRMKRLSIYFLAFLTCWVSSWLVTDVHVDAYQPHSIVVAHSLLLEHDLHDTHQEHQTHCGVCSYDHGGHMGQTLATLPFVAKNIPAQNTLNFPLPSDFWYSRNTTPKLRPPIA